MKGEQYWALNMDAGIIDVYSFFYYADDVDRRYYDNFSMFRTNEQAKKALHLNVYQRAYYMALIHLQGDEDQEKYEVGLLVLS